jgi:hypothetical protein
MKTVQITRDNLIDAILAGQSRASQGLTLDALDVLVGWAESATEFVFGTTSIDGCGCPAKQTKISEWYGLDTLTWMMAFDRVMADRGFTPHKPLKVIDD